jgi:hypothetical protein
LSAPEVAVVSLLLELSQLQLFEFEQHALLSAAAAVVAGTNQQQLQRQLPGKGQPAQPCVDQQPITVDVDGGLAVQCKLQQPTVLPHGSSVIAKTHNECDTGHAVQEMNGALKPPAPPLKPIRYHLQVTILDGEDHSSVSDPLIAHQDLGGASMLCPRFLPSAQVTD